MPAIVRRIGTSRRKKKKTYAKTRSRFTRPVGFNLRVQGRKRGREASEVDAPGFPSGYRDELCGSSGRLLKRSAWRIQCPIKAAANCRYSLDGRGKPSPVARRIRFALGPPVLQGSPCGIRVAGDPDPFPKWDRCWNGQAFGETMILKSIAIWVLFLLVVVASGAFRERFLVPRLGDHRAHQVGTILACLLVFAVMTRAVPWIGPSSGGAWFPGGLLAGTGLGLRIRRFPLCP